MTEPTLSPYDEPEFIFLGLCDLATYVREGNTNVFHWNILGLPNFILSHIFPIVLDGWWIGLAFRWNTTRPLHRFRISDALGNQVETIGLESKVGSPDDNDVVLMRAGPLVPLHEYGWTVSFCTLPAIGILISRPGIYCIEHLLNGTFERIGALQFAVVNPPALSPDRITAIKSDPSAAKAIQIELGCKHCASVCRAYAALERDDTLEQERWVWYHHLPGTFECICGKTTVDLQYIRQNLHGLLGRSMSASGEIEFVPLYHAKALQSTFNTIFHLISRSPKEETVQQFIEENPILLH